MNRRLLAVDVTPGIVDAALTWTYDQVKLLRATASVFEEDPLDVEGGELARRAEPIGRRLSTETKAQCTACTFRFDCEEYRENLGGATDHADIAIGNIFKN